MKELTKAEEEIMQILWKIEKGFVKDIIEQMPEPRPAYNTVSTIVRILEKKGFVGYNAFGKMSGYFGGSLEKLVSFFDKDNNLDVKELDQLMRQVKDNLNENEPQHGSNL